MHTITLKADNKMYDILSSLVDTLGTSRSEVIRKAVLNYKDTLDKEALRKQIIKASKKTRQDSLNLLKDFEDTLNDGLKNV